MFSGGSRGGMPVCIPPPTGLTLVGFRTALHQVNGAIVYISLSRAVINDMSRPRLKALMGALSVNCVFPAAAADDAAVHLMISGWSSLARRYTKVYTRNILIRQVVRTKHSEDNVAACKGNVLS